MCFYDGTKIRHHTIEVTHGSERWTDDEGSLLRSSFRAHAIIYKSASTINLSLFCLLTDYNTSPVLKYLLKETDRVFAARRAEMDKTSAQHSEWANIYPLKRNLIYFVINSLFHNCGGQSEAKKSVALLPQSSLNRWLFYE